MKIYKNGKSMDVTKGAFKLLFSSKGWADTPTEKKESLEYVPADVLEDVPFASLAQQAKVEPPAEEQEEWDEVDIPLSEMTAEELRNTAQRMNIDLPSGSTKAQMRQIIKSVMDEAKK